MQGNMLRLFDASVRALPPSCRPRRTLQPCHRSTSHDVTAWPIPSEPHTIARMRRDDHRHLRLRSFEREAPARKRQASRPEAGPPERLASAPIDTHDRSRTARMRTRRIGCCLLVLLGLFHALTHEFALLVGLRHLHETLFEQLIRQIIGLLVLRNALLDLSLERAGQRGVGTQ